MASSAKHIALFFLLVLVSSSVQIQARESKFFSKIFHLGAKISTISEVPTLSPTPAPAAAPVSAPSESQEPYYGLYGHGRGSGMFPPAKETSVNTPTTTTATTFEDDLLSEELAADGERYETGYGQKDNYNNNVYSSSNYNNNGHFLDNYNNNGYSSNHYTNGYSSNNYKSSNGYSNNYNTNGYSSNYNNNEYETEKQGMSDTRFMEGGKYHYDVKNENYYPNGYETGKETTKSYGGYFGNTENSNEFNSMEELQNREDQYQEINEANVP